MENKMLSKCLGYYIGTSSNKLEYSSNLEKQMVARLQFMHSNDSYFMPASFSGEETLSIKVDFLFYIEREDNIIIKNKIIKERDKAGQFNNMIEIIINHDFKTIKFGPKHILGFNHQFSGYGFGTYIMNYLIQKLKKIKNSNDENILSYRIEAGELSNPDADTVEKKAIRDSFYKNFFPIVVSDEKGNGHFGSPSIEKLKYHETNKVKQFVIERELEINYNLISDILKTNKKIEHHLKSYEVQIETKELALEELIKERNFSIILNFVLIAIIVIYIYIS